jgi:hypothetical protein
MSRSFFCGGAEGMRCCCVGAGRKQRVRRDGHITTEGQTGDLVLTATRYPSTAKWMEDLTDVNHFED